MNKIERVYINFLFFLLTVSLIFGVITAFSFVYPEVLKDIFPFQQLRPMHVSAAMFWIIGGASFSIFLHNQRESPEVNANRGIRDLALILWMLTIIIIFGHYAFSKFGGREYWEFPGWISFLLLLSWIGFITYYYKFWSSEISKRPQYIIMWSTGMLFFLLTFIEQNLWQISWFRHSFIQEVTIQWKANGSMVGAWNQMIYGTSFYLMVKLSGNKQMAYDKKSIAFYFLGFANLLFNWGHHIYNVPTNNWMRHVAYAISMTEWVLFINIIQGFRHTMDQKKRFSHLITYRFILASEFWVFMNLLLALLMSIPALNRYTHGTHVTVAHAMGTTIGINTMILLGSFAYLLKLDHLNEQAKRRFNYGFMLIQISLFAFWICLIIAGVIKGYEQVHTENRVYASVLESVLTAMKGFTVSGIFLLAGFVMILPFYFKGIKNTEGK